MNELNIEELKEQFLKGTFYYYKFGLFVKSKVIRVVTKDNDFLEVSFECGNVDIFINKLKPIRRPGNIIADFEWCYMLQNEYDEVIGYIGLKENDQRISKKKTYMGTLKGILEDIEKIKSLCNKDIDLLNKECEQ